MECAQYTRRRFCFYVELGIPKHIYYRIENIFDIITAAYNIRLSEKSVCGWRITRDNLRCSLTGTGKGRLYFSFSSNTALATGRC